MSIEVDSTNDSTSAQPQPSEEAEAEAEAETEKAPAAAAVAVAAPAAPSVPIPSPSPSTPDWSSIMPNSEARIYSFDREDLPAEFRDYESFRREHGARIGRVVRYTRFVPVRGRGGQGAGHNHDARHALRNQDEPTRKRSASHLLILSSVSGFLLLPIRWCPLRVAARPPPPAAATYSNCSPCSRRST